MVLREGSWNHQGGGVIGMETEYGYPPMLQIDGGITCDKETADSDDELVDDATSVGW